MSEWPTRILRVASDGWLYDPLTNEWARVEGYDYNDKVSLEDGWLRAWLPAEPADNQDDERPPFKGAASLGAGWYVDQYPTHFNWRDDVKRLAFEMERKYWTFACTYHLHPPAYPAEERSVDFWHPVGRGYGLDAETGYAILNDLFYRDDGPSIAWYIYQGKIWMPSTGEYDWWDTDPASDGGHWKHLHITYF